MTVIEQQEQGIWVVTSGRPGKRLAISFGVHGNERPPIDAGLLLIAELERGQLELVRGSLLLLHSNPRASAQDERWSAGGVDLNRCFHASVLAKTPELFEEHRAGAIAAALERHRSEVLVDFHCTVEPGRPFLMQHPGLADEPHRAVQRLLAAEVLLADPKLNFGGVSLDEYMSTRDRVGICYETGWLDDPANTPESVLAEMKNLLVGLGLVEGEARSFEDKRAIELDAPLLCDGEGFRWEDGVGVNLQELAGGTLLGRYGDGREVRLDQDATLIFPKKRPELVQLGKPLVSLARRPPSPKPTS